jgi:hypothetical protein
LSELDLYCYVSAQRFSLARLHTATHAHHSAAAHRAAARVQET